jgi:hypothetical protein
MSRHRRRRAYRLRRRRVHLLKLHRQGCYWLWRYTEFPSLLLSSRPLRQAARKLARAELGVREALEQVGVIVEPPMLPAQSVHALVHELAPAGSAAALRTLYGIATSRVRYEP